MNYLVMVSHGQFAEGTKSVLDMMVGEKREDIIYVGLEKTMSSKCFKTLFLEKTAHLNKEDNILLFGDIIGGSPLTSSIECLNDLGYIPNTTVLSGLNVASAINAVLLKDQYKLEDAKAMIIEEGKNSIMEVNLNIVVEDEEI